MEYIKDQPRVTRRWITRSSSPSDRVLFLTIQWVPLPRRIHFGARPGEDGAHLLRRWRCRTLPRHSTLSARYSIMFMKCEPWSDADNWQCKPSPYRQAEQPWWILKSIGRDANTCRPWHRGSNAARCFLFVDGARDDELMHAGPANNRCEKANVATCRGTKVIGRVSTKTSALPSVL